MNRRNGYWSIGNILLFILICSSSAITAQQNNNWKIQYYNNSIFTFNAYPAKFIAHKSTFTKGYSTAISDCTGELALVTIDRYMYNRNFDAVKNSKRDFVVFRQGDNILIPKPQSDSNYFYFYFNNVEGLFYTEINALADSGKGQVIKKNIKLDDSSLANLCVIKNPSDGNYWVLVSRDCYTMCAYRIDENGVSNTPTISKNVFNANVFKVSKIGPIPVGNTLHDLTTNYIAASNNGHKIVTSNIPYFVTTSGNAFVYDFDLITGKITNGKPILSFSELSNNYGSEAACFSTNDSLVYLSINPYSIVPFSGTKSYRVLQYNLAKNTRRTIRNSTDGKDNITIMAMGPNSKIYGFGNSYYDTSSYGQISIIDFPNKIGLACHLTRPVNFQRGFKLLPNNPNDHLINTRSNLEYANCVDTVRISWQGDSSFAKMTCRFGDGDSAVINSPKTQLYVLKHYYKAEGKYAIIWEGRTKECNSPVWYTDTIVMKYAPQSIAIKPSLEQIPACSASQLQIKDTTIHASYCEINWGDDSIIVYNIDSSTGIINVQHNYHKAGIFNIIVSLKNVWGCSKIYNYQSTIAFLPQPKNCIILSSERCANRFISLKNDSALSTDTIHIEYASMVSKSIGAIANSIKLQYPNDTFLFISTNTYGCKLKDTIVLKVLPGANAAYATSKNAYCLLQTDTAKRLFANANDKSKWEWENAVYPFEKNLAFTAQQVGSHVLSHSIENQFGCKDTFDKKIVVNPLPEMEIEGLKSIYCTKENLRLTLKNTNILDSILWQMKGNKIGNNRQLNYSIIDTGKYKINLYIITQYGCADSAKYSFNFIQSPIVKYNISDTTICSGDILAMSFSGVADSIKWQLNNTFNTNIIWNQYFKAKQGIYPFILIATNSNGCKDTAINNIEVQDLPAANFTYSATCLNENMVFTDKSTGTVIANIWQIQSQKKTGKIVNHVFNQPGNYGIKEIVATSFGCVDSISKTIIVYNLPKPAIYYTGTSYNAPDQYQYFFESRPDTFKNYSWNFGTAGTGNISSAYINFQQSEKVETIHLEVTDIHNCKGFADSIINIRGLTLYLFPNAFTPDGDRINDGFGIAGAEYVKTYKLWIFNRWGENVFYTENPFEKWTPKNAVPGEYVYKAKVQDLYSRWKEVKGIVLLVK